MQPSSCARWAPVQTEGHSHRPAAGLRCGGACGGAHRSFLGTQVPPQPGPSYGPSVTLCQQLLGGDLVPPDGEHPAQGGRTARSSGSAARSAAAAAPLGLGHAGELLHGERGPEAAGDGELPASHAAAPRPLPAASALRGEEEEKEEEGRKEGRGRRASARGAVEALPRAARGGITSGEGAESAAVHRAGVNPPPTLVSQAGARPEVTFSVPGGGWAGPSVVVRSRAVRGRLSVCPLSASMRAVGVGVLGEGCAGLPAGGITVQKGAARVNSQQWVSTSARNSE